MSSQHSVEPFRYSEDDRDAREEYYRARADMREAKRSGAGFGPRWNAFKRINFYGRLVSAFDEGIHRGYVEVHTRGGVLVQCTCGLLCRDDSELISSGGHRDMTSWQVADVVILRVSRAADERSEPTPFVARCQGCGQLSPRCELKTAKDWQATHQCDESTTSASQQQTSELGESGTEGRS